MDRLNAVFISEAQPSSCHPGRLSVRSRESTAPDARLSEDFHRALKALLQSFEPGQYRVSVDVQPLEIPVPSRVGAQVEQT
jgi:hypothetical protein